MTLDEGETVTRLRAPRVIDAYKASRADWANAVATDLGPCGVAPGGSVEQVEVGRESVVSDFDIIAPPDVDVVPTDRLVVRGLTCEVQGRPAVWRSPLTGWSPGVLIRVKIVEG